MIEPRTPWANAVVAASLAIFPATVSAAESVAAPVESIVAPALTLNIATLFDQPETSPVGETAATTPEQAGAPASEPVPGYGRAGTDWLTFGGLYASDFDKDNDFNVHFSWSRFIVDDIEFVLEAAGWYFNQEGQDTGGLSGSFLFRWHFLTASDHRWTVFGDLGIGMLGSFDEVPDGGTSFNFLPRAGLGFTRAFNESIDGESHGARWELGLRWHHISNGRIEGDERNPARDSVAFYAGIIIPF
jgi:hypothetical protein